MARVRTPSPAIKTADQRIIGLNGISPNLDLGDGVSVASITNQRDQAKALLDRHNTLVSELGILSNQLTEANKALNTLNSRALALVRGRYGVDSNEYERVGGTRQSERKRSPRRPVQPA